MAAPGDRIGTAQALELPDASVFAGNALLLARNGLRFFEECERLGPLVRARIYLKRIYVVTGPALIEEVLIKKARSFTKPALLRDLKSMFGESLLTADGDLWKHRRRVVQPAFHARQREEHGRIITEGVESMLARWKPGKRDVHPDLIDTCIVNLTRSFFGVSNPVLTDRVRTLATMCHGFVQALGDYRTPMYLFPSLLARRFRTNLEELGADIEELAKNCRARGDRGDDFLTRIASARDVDGCPMGGKAIRDEAITMLLAGHETAAAAVSWGLYLLAKNPEVRRRLCDELDEVCGERLPTLADLPRLPWLDKVLLETYRLYPPTHRIGRTVAEPVSLDGVELDVGSELIVPQWAVHRSARWFEAPEEFRPERWTNAFIDQLPRFAFLPFSGGPRICIGQAFVTLENTLLLGSIVKAFDFELQPGARVEPVEGLTLLPGEHGTMPLVLRKRAGAAPSRPRHPEGTPAALSSTRLLAATNVLDDEN